MRSMRVQPANIAFLTPPLPSSCTAFRPQLPLCRPVTFYTACACATTGRREGTACSFSSNPSSQVTKIADAVNARRTSSLPNLLRDLLPPAPSVPLPLSNDDALDILSSYRSILKACVLAKDLRSLNAVLRIGLSSPHLPGLHVFHIVPSLRLLASSGWWRSVFFFLDSMQLSSETHSPSLAPDARLLVALANIAVEINAYSHSIRIFTWMTKHHVPLGPFAYSVMLKSHGRAGNVVAVKRVISTLSKLRVPVDTVLLNSALDALVRCDDIRAAHQIVLNHAYAQLVDVTSYNTVIKGYAANQQVRSAFTLASRMQATGIQPCPVTINTLLSACVSISDFDTALQLFESYSSSQRLVCKIPIPPADPRPSAPSPEMKKALLASPRTIDIKEDNFSNKPNENLDAEEQSIFDAPLVVDTSLKSSRTPRSSEQKNEHRQTQLRIAMTTILSGFAEADRFEDALTLLNDMTCRGAPPSSITYASLISSCLKQRKVTEAMHVFRSTDGPGPNGEHLRNVHVYKALVSGLCALEKLEFVEAAANIVHDMLKNTSDQGDGSFVETNAVTTTTRKMKIVQPTVQMMNAILKGFVDHGRFADAERLLTTMSHERIGPNIASFTVLMIGYADTNQFSQAKNMFREMSRRHLQPDRVAMNAFVSVCCRSGDAEAAVKMIAFMERRKGGFSPNAQTYMPVLKLNTRLGNERIVWETYDRMRSQKVPVNNFVMKLLVDYILSEANAAAERRIALPDRVALRAGQLLRNGLEDSVSESVLRRTRRKFLSVFTAEQCEKYFDGLDGAGMRSASETIFERHGWNNIDSGWRVF